MNQALKFLKQLNEEYFNLHKKYEELYWLFYMGDHSVEKKLHEALDKKDAFNSNKKYHDEIKKLMETADVKTKERLQIWLKYFENFQMKPEVLAIKNKISRLESYILSKKAQQKEGYIDPYTKKFITASTVKMRAMISTNPDEKIRKACFDAREKLALGLIKEYVELIKLRNEYSRALGFSDFYDFKVRRDDGMTKKELFDIFDSIYEKTKYAFKNIRELEKTMPGLRKPWNTGYMMAGDFTKKEDPYFQFDEAIPRWGASFANLGIDFKKGSLYLDLMDRKGKYNNGFCHWTGIVYFKKGKRFPGKADFTCTVVKGQIGSGIQGYATLFHEGGHAAHLLNCEQKEVILNHEYFPMSTSWAETQSMFLDTLFSSIEWKTRYAEDKNGHKYPFELYERKVKKLSVMKPLDMSSIIFVSQFEKEIYESKSLTIEKVKAIAKKNYRKYFDASVDSLSALNIPHIYSWESSAAYHCYGLAELAVYQWREYFTKKYGYIVDNKNVGKEMIEVWKLGSSKTFKDFVSLATGKKLSAEPFLKIATRPEKETIKKAKESIEKMKKIRQKYQPEKLNVEIHMVDGKKEITNNKKGFDKMAEDYKKWINSK